VCEIGVRKTKGGGFFLASVAFSYAKCVKWEWEWEVRWHAEVNGGWINMQGWEGRRMVPFARWRAQVACMSLQHRVFVASRRTMLWQESTHPTYYMNQESTIWTGLRKSEVFIWELWRKKKKKKKEKNKTAPLFVVVFLSEEWERA
jgi:hypothetical protein